MPKQVQLDELMSAAYLGLVDAATRYNGKDDFAKFAGWRVLGEIKDYLRSLKWGCHTNKLASIPENYEQTAEEEPESFDEILEYFTKCLKPREKIILRMYYGENLPHNTIAQKLNISDGRVSQIIKKNLSKIRLNLNKAS